MTAEEWLEMQAQKLRQATGTNQLYGSGSAPQAPPGTQDQLAQYARQHLSTPPNPQMQVQPVPQMQPMHHAQPMNSLPVIPPEPSPQPRAFPRIQEKMLPARDVTDEDQAALLNHDQDDVADNKSTQSKDDEDED